MTEAVPDIPAWSPVADRARRRGDDDVDDGAPDPGHPLPPTDDGRRRGTWLAIGLLVGLVLALFASTLLRDDDTEPTPTTVVRDPQPSTSYRAPAPIGDRVALGNGWAVSVRGVDANATRGVRPLNPDTPLEEGQRYVLIDVEMTYLDGVPDEQTPFLGVDLAVVDEDGIVTTPSDAPCVAPEPELDLTSEVARGASARGRICFPVDADRIAGLRLVAEPSMTYGSTPSYLALAAPR